MCLKIIVSVISILFVLKKTDIREVLSVLKTVDWKLLLPATLFFIVSKLVSAYRLNIYFRNINVIIPEKINLKLYLLGMFYNLFLPGGIGGDGYKVWVLSKNTGSKARYLAAAVLLDRICGMTVIMVIVLLSALFISVFGLFRLFVPFLIFLLLIGYRMSVKKIFPSFGASINITTIYSVVVQVFQIITILFIAWATGFSGGVNYLILIFLLSSVVAVLPFTIGGLGAREVVFMYGSNMLSVSVGESLAISILFFLITALISLTGFWYLIFPPLNELRNSL
jgi:uncharacterized membrane protein YbhN (UPF0104 family)